MNRNLYKDVYLEDMLPAIREIIFEAYGTYPSVLPHLFNMEKSDRSIEQITQMTEFGLVPEKAEGSAVDFDTSAQGYDKTFTHALYKLGFSTTKEMIDDDKFGITKKYAKALGKSAAQTREVLGASHFNNAFGGAFLGPDGVSLCNASHPHAWTGTQSNVVTASDLSVTSLRAMVNAMESLVNQRGLRIMIKPKYLLVPREEQWNAEELLKSRLKPDTAENATNAFTMKGLEYIVWDYLTDTDATFVVSEPADNHLYWFDREMPTLDSEYDFDTDSGKTKLRFRCSSGWADYRWLVGNQGI